jgi:hypothetical protein
MVQTGSTSSRPILGTIMEHFMSGAPIMAGAAANDGTPQ